MALNLFEGARRIAYLTAGLWAIGVLAVVFSESPNVTANYAVFSPDLPPGRAEDVKCGPHDRAEWEYRTTTKGTSVRVMLCFVAHNFEGGKMLVPYRTDKKMMWGNDKYSSDVTQYAAQRVREFSMSAADQDWADSRYWPARADQAWTVARWVASGWLALWLFTVAVGWIVRGFAGIPNGQDHKPRA
jgi:hypothetical protein